MTVSSAERRNAILKAAARLFQHYGHGKTTIADVAREARIGVGTVYLEFESKEAIVRELSLSTHVSVLDAMRAASAREDDPADRLTAVLVARTRSFLELRSKGQHACELVFCKTEGVQTAYARFVKDERALLAEIVRDGQRRGAFAGADPRLVAEAIQRAFASLSPPSIFGDEAGALAAARNLSRLLLNGLLTRRERASIDTESRRHSAHTNARHGRRGSTREP